MGNIPVPPTHQLNKLNIFPTVFFPVFALVGLRLVVVGEMVGFPLPLPFFLDLAMVGGAVAAAVGCAVGATADGLAVGEVDGLAVGAADGLAVRPVGLDVGASVHVAGAPQAAGRQLNSLHSSLVLQQLYIFDDCNVCT